MHQNGEPSVEEILESIKKVIARENAPALGNGPFGRRQRLVDQVDRVEPAATDEAEEVLELAEDAVVAQSEDRGDFEPADDVPGYDPDAPLTAEATSSAMRENFAALAMLAQPSRPPQIVRSGETSLEELTRDLLRPMLAKWLDEHLPALVEELVKAEIARIAGKKS